MVGEIAKTSSCRSLTFIRPKPRPGSGCCYEPTGYGAQLSGQRDRPPWGSQPGHRRRGGRTSRAAWKGRRTKQGQHHAFASEWGLVAQHAGGKERHRSIDEVAVSDGTSRTVGPVELRKGVQLNCATEDITIESQGFTSSAGKWR